MTFFFSYLTRNNVYTHYAYLLGLLNRTLGVISSSPQRLSADSVKLIAIKVLLRICSLILNLFYFCQTTLHRKSATEVLVEKAFYLF